MTTEESSIDESFINRYGGEPLPFADGRGELIRLLGELIAAIPLFGGFIKLLVGFAFWSYGIQLKILKIITGNADVMQRFIADFEYLKDSFYTGYNGENAPPSPPK